MEIKDFVHKPLTINNDVGQISEHKINLDTIQMFGKCKHTPWGIGASAGNKILQIIRNIYSHCNRALAQVHFSPVSRKFRLIG